MTTPKTSNDKVDAALVKSGVKLVKKTGALKEAKTAIVKVAPKKAKAIKAISKAEKAIAKLLVSTAATAAKIDATLRIEVKSVSKVVRAYVVAALAFNKTLGVGATDTLDVAFPALRKHVKGLAGNPDGETIGKCIRRGIKLALLPIQTPKVFKAAKDGGATAKNMDIYDTMTVKSESGSKQEKNTVPDMTDVAQSEIERLHSKFSPDVEKKGADGLTKEQKASADALALNGSVEGMTVEHLVNAIEGRTSNGKASLESLSLNELKNCLRMAVCLAQFQMDAKEQGFDNVTNMLQSMIKNYGEQDPSAIQAA